jgi:hypothetical protein
LWRFKNREKEKNSKNTGSSYLALNVIFVTPYRHVKACFSIHITSILHPHRKHGGFLDKGFSLRSEQISFEPQGASL